MVARTNNIRLSFKRTTTATFSMMNTFLISLIGTAVLMEIIANGYKILSILNVQ